MGIRYRVLAHVEEGAYWESYRGVGDGGGVPVLIRLYSPKASDRAHAEALAAFSARTRALGNPRALGDDEVGFVGERLAAVRPWVDGHALLDGLRRLQSKEVVLTPPAALYAVSEAAAVVALAHRAGFAHGSLAPAAIFLSTEGRVYVESFGALQALAAAREMAAVAAKGYPGYRAPELKRPLDAAPSSDVYALGALAYELLTLRSAAPAKGSRLSTKREGVAPPSRLDRRIHARIDAVVQRAIEPSPARRYSSAGELAEALEAVVAELGATPEAADLARFVRELFPAGVSVGAGTSGPVPIEGPFELEPVSGGARPRSPPLRPRAVSIDEGAEALTQPALPAFPSAVQPKPGRQAAAAPRADELSWDAPPGEVDRSPRLRALPKQAGGAPSGLARKRVASFSASPPAGPRKRHSDAAPAPVFAPAAGEVFRRTEADWHAPPGEPTPAPEPKRRRRWRVGILIWLALCVVGALIAPAVVRRLHRGPEEPSGARGPKRSPPAPQLSPSDQEPRPRAPPGTLSLQTDVPAAVFIDGVDTGRVSPIARYPLAPGEHTVLLVHAASGASRELTVRIASGEDLKRAEKVEPGRNGR